MKIDAEFIPGLEGVIAAETEISLLVTEEEKIVIKGYDLIELSKDKDYLDIIHLLLADQLPNQDEKVRVEERLQDGYLIPSVVLEVLELLPKETHPMDSLRTGISILAGYDEQIDDRSLDTTMNQAYDLIAKVPTITANSYRILSNQKVIQPNRNLSYSANFLYMITGKIPSEEAAHIFDRSLLLYSEHEMPNSTFTARVIASTNSDIYGALTGAISSLKGNLHGGANESVMYTLLEADSVPAYEELLMKKLYRKEKVMGFGHRVYMKKMDPRALIMKQLLKQLCEKKGDSILLEMCEAGEKLMQEEKGIYPNLDYYAAPVYWMLGIPIKLYTPIFFCARTVGLCAHIIEQYQNNRLYRPRVNYIGEPYD